MTARCPRLWEVEAARDRRLSHAALAVHDTHVATCHECARERDAFETLARELRDAERDSDEVSLRRLRHATLERAFVASREPSRSPARVRWAASALALAAAGAVVFAFVRHERAAQAAPSIVVSAGNSGATWTRRSARGVEQIDLSDGAFSLVVHRRPTDPRVIVRVPEGEIEDFGTAFDVSVRAGRTQRIAVREGAVVYRRRGAAPLRLSAGMIWSANDVAPAPVAPAPAPAPAQPQPVVAPAKVAAPLVVPLARTPRAARVAASVTRVVADAPARDAQPSTAAEDAAYLHVLALLREARGEEARLAASLYLQRFPNGFRVPEMQRIALP